MRWFTVFLVNRDCIAGEIKMQRHASPQRISEFIFAWILFTAFFQMRTCLQMIWVQIWNVCLVLLNYINRYLTEKAVSIQFQVFVNPFNNSQIITNFKSLTSNCHQHHCSQKPKTTNINIIKVAAVTSLLLVLYCLFSPAKFSSQLLLDS